MKVKALPDRVLAHNMKKGERMIGSIILTDDNRKEHGIRPRWMQVYDVGSEITDIKVGEWILVAHGRWTRGFNIPKNDNPQGVEDYDTYYQVDYPDGVLVVTDEEPEDNVVNDTRSYTDMPKMDDMDLGGL